MQGQQQVESLQEREQLTTLAYDLPAQVCRAYASTTWGWSSLNLLVWNNLLACEKTLEEQCRIRFNLGGTGVTYSALE